MFCAKCGKELPENAASCPDCGNGQAGERYRKSNRLLNNKKMVKIVAICTAAVLVLVLVLLCTAGGSLSNNSAEEVVECWVTAYLEKDFETVVACYADWTVREMLNKGKFSSVEEMVTYMEVSNKYSDLPIFQAKVVGCSVKEYIKLKDLKWQKMGMTETEYNSVNRAAVVIVSIYVEGFGTENAEMNCVEIDGKWYVTDALRM